MPFLVVFFANNGQPHPLDHLLATKPQAEFGVTRRAGRVGTADILSA